MWSQPVTSGTGPSPRDKLASAVIGQNIYYFGGFGPKASPAVRNGAFAFNVTFFDYYKIMIFDIWYLANSV